MQRAAAFLSTLTFASMAFAQESGLPAPADGFAAPNGELGAGLPISRQGALRVFGEFGFYTQGTEQNLLVATVETHITSFSWVLGGGYKITPNLEIDAMLPMGFGHESISAAGAEQSDSGIGVGNLHVGVSFMKAQEKLRFKFGGALEWGPWNSDYDAGPAVGVTYGAFTRGMQDAGLWAQDTFTILAPGRIEYGDDLVVAGDAALGFHIPTDNGDVDVSFLLAPGVAYAVSDGVLIGARLPMFFMLTDSNDKAQLGFEPNVRFALGRNAFLNARFTLNLDEPLGFAFDDGGVWGLHVGGGGTF